MSSLAFIGVGTVTLLDGKPLREVSFISIGQRVFLRANYIPSDPVQNKLLEAGSKHEVDLKIILPGERAIYSLWRVIPDAKIKILPHDVVRLIASFPATCLRVEVKAAS